MKTDYTPHHHSTPAVRPRKRNILVRLLPLWIVSGAVAAVMVMVSSLKSPPESIPKPDPARLVETITATPGDIHFDVNTFGSVQPRTETTMVAEVSGQVVRVAPKFAAGGFFKEGEVLLQIDPSDYQTALLSAEASLASRQAALAQEQAQSDQARKDWQRLNPGREPNALVLRLPQLDGAKAAVRSAEADVLKARRDLERTHIRMPYDGLVKTRTADLGQYVTPGAAVGDVFAVDVAEIRLSLSDEELGYVDLPALSTAGEIMGPAVELSAPVRGQNVQWDARIVRTEGVVDTNSRMIYAVAEVADPYGLLGAERAIPLKVGTFVSARIVGRLGQGIVRVPRAVLQPDNTLLIAGDDDKLEVRPVQVVRTTPEAAYIGQGLTPGDRIITTSISAPIPGLAVRTTDSTEAAPTAAVAEQALVNSTHTGVAQ